MSKIYFAAPLFSRAEIDFNKQLSSTLLEQGFEIFLPQDMCIGIEGKDIFNTCKRGIEESALIVAILDGTDHDSGTAWECGYAYGLNKPIIGVRTDFRQTGDTKGFNAMLFYSATIVIEDTDVFISKLINAINKILNKGENIN